MLLRGRIFGVVAQRERAHMRAKEPAKLCLTGGETDRERLSQAALEPYLLAVAVDGAGCGSR